MEKDDSEEDRVQALKDTINRLMRSFKVLDPHNKTARQVLGAELAEAKAKLLSLRVAMTEVDKDGNYGYVEATPKDILGSTLSPKILVPATKLVALL